MHRIGRAIRRVGIIVRETESDFEIAMRFSRRREIRRVQLSKPPKRFLRRAQPRSDEWTGGQRGGSDAWLRFDAQLFDLAVQRRET